MMYFTIFLALAMLTLFVLVIFAIVGKIFKFVYKRAGAYLLCFASLLDSKLKSAVFGTRNSIKGHYQDRVISVQSYYTERFPYLAVSTMAQTVPSDRRSSLLSSRKPTKNTFLDGKKVYWRKGLGEIIVLDTSTHESEIKMVLDELLEAVRIVEQGGDLYK